MLLYSRICSKFFTSDPLKHKDRNQNYDSDYVAGKVREKQRYRGHSHGNPFPYFRLYNKIVLNKACKAYDAKKSRYDNHDYFAQSCVYYNSIYYLRTFLDQKKGRVICKYIGYYKSGYGKFYCLESGPHCI